MGDEGWMEFVRLGYCLHACDVMDKLNFINSKFLNYSLAQLWIKIKTCSLTEKNQRANQVRKLCIKIGRPGLQSFNTMLDENQMTNCPYASRDAKVADAMHEKELSAVRGREIRNLQQSEPVIRIINTDHALKDLYKRLEFLQTHFLLMAFLSYLPYHKPLVHCHQHCYQIEKRK